MSVGTVATADVEDDEVVCNDHHRKLACLVAVVLYCLVLLEYAAMP